MKYGNTADIPSPADQGQLGRVDVADADHGAPVTDGQAHVPLEQGGHGAVGVGAGVQDVLLGQHAHGQTGLGALGEDAVHVRAAPDDAPHVGALGAGTGGIDHVGGGLQRVAHVEPVELVGGRVGIAVEDGGRALLTEGLQEPAVFLGAVGGRLRAVDVQELFVDVANTGEKSIFLLKMHTMVIATNNEETKHTAEHDNILVKYPSCKSFSLSITI